MITILIIVAFFQAAIPSAQASEPLFGYVYTTDTLPQGHPEIEQWVTDREGQAYGHFNHIDMSTELEYGVTDNFQAALYFNYMYASEGGNSVTHLTEGIEIPPSHDDTKSYNAARFDGISAEFIYRVLSPYVDPIGLAFYLEPELGYYESGLESRVIAQKNFMDDQLVFAANFWVEFDHEQSSNLGIAPGTDLGTQSLWSSNTYAEIDLGASYRFAPHWSFGVEFRNHNEYRSWTISSAAQDHTAFFLGPNIHYAAERWFFTFSALRQIHAIAFTDDQRAQMLNGLLFGDEHTDWDGLRLKVGFPF
jgi:hypothetical protein